MSKKVMVSSTEGGGTLVPEEFLVNTVTGVFTSTSPWSSWTTSSISTSGTITSGGTAARSLGWWFTPAKADLTEEQEEIVRETILDQIVSMFVIVARRTAPRFRKWSEIKQQLGAPASVVLTGLDLSGTPSTSISWQYDEV